MSKKSKKRKVKKIIWLVFIILMLIIISILGFKLYKNYEENGTFNLFYTSTDERLEKIGYSKEEIDDFHLKLNDIIINDLLNKDYISSLNDLINEENFKIDNLDKYLEAINLYSLELNEIVYLVNSEYYDPTKEYTSYNIELMQSNYYINDNVDRYLAYHEKNKDVITKELIARVNVNLDYDYYTNTKDTDMSKGYLILVNKYNKLASNYVPKNLVAISTKYGRPNLKVEKKTYEQYAKMCDAAKLEELTLYATSPYRSYNTQLSLYKSYVARDGIKEADTYSARAGFSEHQTGLAIDILTPGATMNNFINTKEYMWLIKNAHKYGFILRYPKGKEHITGYMFESWHYRYVGIEEAAKIYEKGITFDEYYAYYIEDN